MWAAAYDPLMGSRRSSTNELTCRSYCLAAIGINCHSPDAPAREVTLGLSADSITGRYFSSNGSW